LVGRPRGAGRYCRSKPPQDGALQGTSKNLLRVALLFCDAPRRRTGCTLVQLRFSNNIAAARDGFSRFPPVVFSPTQQSKNDTIRWNYAR